MSPERARAALRLLAGCMLLACQCQHAASQSITAADTLTRLEQSIEQGRFAEAEKPLLDYAVAHPQEVRSLYLLGQVRERQGRFEEAGALYRRVLALDPAHVRAKILLGQLMYAAGERDEARRMLNAVAQNPPAEPRVQLSLARALVLVGEYASALAGVERLPRALRNAEALPVAAASYLALGERRKLTALIPSMRRAAAVKPSVAAQCAAVLHDAGMLAEAVAVLRLALATAPNDARLLVASGRMETDAKDFARARAHLARALALDARSVDALAARAALEGAEGDFAAAFSSLNTARTLAPDSANILAQFVVAAMRAGRAQAAVEGAGALLKLQPDDAESLYLFGAASLQAGSLAAAQNALERYAKERPRDSRGCLALGIVLAGQHEQASAARAQFERCLQLDPANVEAKYQLSLVHKSQGDTQHAVQLLEEVTTSAPRHASALRDLGALYLQTGADRRARDVLTRAVALDPQDAETHFQLSRLYNRAGQSALAAEHLALFQKLKSRREKGTAQ